MRTNWVLQNRGDLLETIEKFLYDVWGQALLDGMIVPRHVPGALGAQPVYLDDRKQLERVDPFAPSMAPNAARLVAQLAREHPPRPLNALPDGGARLGAVLRPCEARAFLALAGREMLPPVLIIGVDCLGTFTAEDYAWRAEKYGEEWLTRDALQFAPQGGIALYRDRLACQTCVAPMLEEADLSLGLLGLRTRQFMLVTARDAEAARRLHLDLITDGEASPELVAQHERMRVTLAERRGRALTRLARTLPPDLPRDVNALITYLVNCAPCQACLTACPIYADELAGSQSGGDVSRDAVSRWLAACVGCGLCEEACPKHAPLSLVMNSIHRNLLREWMAV